MNAVNLQEAAKEARAQAEIARAKSEDADRKAKEAKSAAKAAKQQYRQAKKAAKLAKKAAKKQAAVEAAAPAAVEKKPADTITLDQVRKVAQTIKTLGGSVRLHELLGLIKDIGGLKKFKDLLEAISGTETDAIPF